MLDLTLLNNFSTCEKLGEFQEGVAKGLLLHGRVSGWREAPRSLRRVLDVALITVVLFDLGEIGGGPGGGSIVSALWRKFGG